MEKGLLPPPRLHSSVSTPGDWHSPLRTAASPRTLWSLPKGLALWVGLRSPAPEVRSRVRGRRHARAEGSTPARGEETAGTCWPAGRRPCRPLLGVSWWVPPPCAGQGFGPLHGGAAAWRRMAATAGAAGPEGVSSERVRCARVSSSSRGRAEPRSWKGRAERGRRCALHSVALGASGASPQVGTGVPFILRAFVDTRVCHALTIRQWTGHAELRLSGERQ